MVCVGESETLPKACELFVTVRVVPPAAAVMVTEEAFVVCHDSVTLCPLLMEVLLAENVSVGEPDFWLPPSPPEPHPAIANRLIAVPMRRAKEEMPRPFILGSQPKFLLG